MSNSVSCAHNCKLTFAPPCMTFVLYQIVLSSIRQLSKEWILKVFEMCVNTNLYCGLPLLQSSVM